MKKCKVGLIGCGDISKVYLNSMVNVFNNTDVVAVSSRRIESARQRAAEFNIPCACSNEELLSMDIDIVVVLTDPNHHYPVVKQALLAGKNVYVEKPLSTNCVHAAELIQLAKEKDLFLTCAPDTLLGAGTQTCRKLIEEGLIGEPIGSIGQTFNGGPEPWHPNPFFFYKPGAGPLFDVGPYYIGDILYLMGPAKRVCCMAKTTFKQRVIGSELHRGEVIDVEVPTYYASTVELNGGEICSSFHTFDVPHTRLDTRIEIYGTEGTVLVSPPCDFSGEILFRGNKDTQWRVLENQFAFDKNCRGIGVADMADALINGRKPRLTPEFAYHTLDVIESLHNSAITGEFIDISSTFESTPLMEQHPNWSIER